MPGTGSSTGADLPKLFINNTSALRGRFAAPSLALAAFGGSVVAAFGGSVGAASRPLHGFWTCYCPVLGLFYTFPQSHPVSGYNFYFGPDFYFPANPTLIQATRFV